MTNAIVIYAKKILLSKRGKYKNQYFVTVGYWWYEFLNQWRWSVFKNKGKRTYYARTYIHDINNKTKGCPLIHRFILHSNKIVDHIDLDGLNCVPHNLREATNSQNSANRRCAKNSSSKYLGVHLNRSRKKYKWVAAIRKNKKAVYIGGFQFTEEGEMEAAKAYDKAAKELHGEFANINFK